jgi:hypothetical protein
MENKGNKVWICLSTNLNGMTAGYFLSVVQDISAHVSAFVACPGAQVYWWLRRRGCLTEDINCLIRHCFSLSQQQKVTASKFPKDLGHAMVKRSDGDNIIQASSLEGIYDLMLGLSDKECWSLVSRGHNAAAITFDKAKEWAIEAHNFTDALSLTPIRSAKGMGKETAESPTPNPTLAQSIYSIGTSKVTNDSEDRSDDNDEHTDGGSENNQVSIDGMDIVTGNDGQGAKLFLTASMEKESARASEEERNMEEDSKAGTTSKSADSSSKEDVIEVLRLTARMEKATASLQLGSEEEASKGSSFSEDDLSVGSGNLDLQLSDYNSDAQEV